MSDITEAVKRDRIEVTQFIDPIELRKDIRFSTADLSSAMMEQASLFVHYGILLSQCSRQVDQLKTRLELAESAVYRHLRDEAANATPPVKMTEPQLAAKVAIHPSIRVVKIAINEAKQIESTAKTAVEGFRHRRDMLVQQGILFREEMKGELTVARKNLVAEQQQTEQGDLVARLKAIDAAKAA